MLRFVPEDTQCFVVMDLEWNQHASKPNHEIPHEIIEIGAVKLDRDLRILDEQQYIIKPVVYPVLDKHIREVTGIEPEELEDGLSFERAYHRFLKWCGSGAFLCTWGRDDYPVLLRNTRYYKLPLELAPPLNVQMVFSHLKTDKPLVQVGLSAAMEQLGMAMDLPAHRALNDAIYTAQVMARLQQDVDAAPPEAIDALKKFNAEEALAALSDTRSVPTGYTSHDDVLGNERMVAVRCPVCGGATRMTLPWFDTGHGRYIALCDCPEHGTSFAQMHFKRLYNNKLVMHQRAYLASPERIADVMARRNAARKTLPRAARKAQRPEKGEPV